MFGPLILQLMVHLHSLTKKLNDFESTRMEEDCLDCKGDDQTKYRDQDKTETRSGMVLM